MLVFIDETGDHSFQKIDKQYPFFALGALIIEESEYQKLDATVSQIKHDFFNDDGTFILHASELKRPADVRSDSRNRGMANPDLRKQFYDCVGEKVIGTIDFRLLACFVKKPEMVSKYVYPSDPYYFAFENILNRVIRYGGSMNVLYAEKRGPELDTELVAEYERLCKVGIHFFDSDTLRARTTLNLVQKKENMNGLQMIDLILASLARASLGKRAKMIGNDIDPDLLVKKLACDPTYFPWRK